MNQLEVLTQNFQTTFRSTGNGSYNATKTKEKKINERYGMAVRAARSWCVLVHFVEVIC